MRLGLAPVVAAAVVLAACGGPPGTAPAPTAGSSRGRIPDLLGATVMVMPVQSLRGVTGDATAELVDALRARGQGVHWLMPDTLRIALQRSPSLDVPLEQLPVGVFLRAQVNRLGDPMFGYLRRLNALTGARVALIPVEVRRGQAAADRRGADEYAAALVDAESGRVFWFGIVRGESGEAGSPRSLASAADALARTLLPQP